jgi:type IV pilus assembly protein PilQ
MTSRRARPLAVVWLASLLLLAGCAAQRPQALVQDGSSDARDAVEETIKAAATSMDEGDFDHASELLRGELRTAASYHYMPEILYLLGQSELQGGDGHKAGLSFRLLRQYYPRRWEALPDRAELAALADESENGTVSFPAVAEIGTTQSSTGSTSPSSTADSEFADVPISNLFYMTDISEVLMDVSSQAGVSIAATAGVRGLVTAEFDDVPLESCLDRLVTPLGLTWRWMDGYYLVGEANPDDPGSTPLTITVEVRPRHLLAAEAAEKLPLSYSRYVRVGAVNGGNTLSVTGSPDLVKKFMRDLASIDQPPRQVVLEAMVVQVGSDVTREWGIDWNVLGTDDGTTFRLAKLAPAVTDSSFIGQILNADVGGLDGVESIGAAVRALEESGDANVKANPRVATLDGQEAKIRVGTEAYYSLLSGSVSYAYYTLQKIATGVTLTITPYVGASSEITSDISVEVSDVSASGPNGLPVTSVREVETRARVGNGESVVIGGLLSETQRTTGNKIPLLGSIPLLGGLFGHTRIENVKSELLVLVTPYIMIHPAELAGLLE